MQAIEILSNEHRVIEQVLTCLEKLVDAGPTDPRFDWPTAQCILDFFRNFADRCHHGKEEERLFPMLEARGFSPTAGPTAVMRGEHEQGRVYMAAMWGAVRRGERGDHSAFTKFARAARDYITMLRTHIQKEDSCLFPMAAHVLRNADEDMVRQFEEVEHSPALEGEHEKYLALADELAERFGVPQNATAKTCGGQCCCHH